VREDTPARERSRQVETAAVDDQPGWSRLRTAGLVASLFVLSAAAAAYEIAPAGVTPLVRSSLGVGPAAAGFLVSVMYGTALVASVPAGVVLDRVGVTRAVVVAAVALLVAGAWGYAAAVAGAYWWLVASRLLGGLAYVVLWNAGANLVGGAVAPDARATAVGVFTASAPFGFALGQFGAPRIAGVAGWPAVLPAFAGLAAVGVVLFVLSTVGRSLTMTTEVPDRAALASLFGDRAVWTVCVLGFIAFSLYLFLNSWLPSYLAEELGVGLALSGLLTALFPAVGVFARTGGGVLSDRLFGGRRRPVAVLAFAVALPGVAGLVVTTHVGSVVGLVVTAGLGVQLAIGLLFSYVAELVPSEVGATAVALLTAVGLGGAGFAPVAAGVVIERAGYRPAFLVATVVAVIGVALAWYAPEPGRTAGGGQTDSPEVVSGEG
jgi:nitrate/nitrite transporter NarK